MQEIQVAGSNANNVGKAVLLASLGEPGDASIAGQIKALVESSRSIAISGHERPDGDCIGSEVALCLILREAGFKAEVVNADPTPAKYKFMDPGIIRNPSPETLLDADLVIVVDAPDLSRLGRLKREQFPTAKLICIDHHLRSSNFGEVNWVDTRAAAAAELVWRLAAANGWKVPPAAFPALYTAIMTDTGHFAYSNTTSRILRMAAELVDLGVETEYIWRKIYLNKTHAELLLEARARASLECAANGRICSISVTQADFSATGTGPQDTEEFVGIPRSLIGVEVAIFFYEIENGRRTKASLRSTREIDVSALAQKFGGGGHRQAAGCTLPGNLAEAKKLLMPEAEKAIPTAAV